MVLASTAFASGTASAAPNNAAPADPAAGSASLKKLEAAAQQWQKNSADLRRTAKPGQSQPLVLPGKKTGVGTASVITCYVQVVGPEGIGFSVLFAIAINCVGGVPHALAASMNMALWDDQGFYEILPESRSDCIGNPGDVSLVCYSEAHCVGAGGYYDGYAKLFALDENDQPHEAEVYAPPRFVPCLI
jgi:hypothetical protein